MDNIQSMITQFNLSGQHEMHLVVGEFAKGWCARVCDARDGDLAMITSYTSAEVSGRTSIAEAIKDLDSLIGSSF